MLGAIAEQLMFWLVERSRRCGGGYCEVARKGTGWRLLGDVGPGTTRWGLWAARRAHKLERQPALARHRRRLLLHGHHVRQHGCLLLTTLHHQTNSLYFTYTQLLIMSIVISLNEIQQYQPIAHYFFNVSIVASETCKIKKIKRKQLQEWYD